MNITSIKSDKFFKPIRLDDCIDLCRYDEIEIDISRIINLFKNPFLKFIELSDFLNNIKTIKVYAELKNKPIRIIWKMIVNKDNADYLSDIIDVAKKYGIYSLVIYKEDGNIKKGLLELFDYKGYKKIVDFIKSTSENSLSNGLCLNFIKKIEV